MINRVRTGVGFRILSAGLAVLVVQLALARRAEAHNGDVHRDMTDLSYQIMLAVAYQRDGGAPSGRGGSVLSNPGVDPVEWEQFLAAVAKAPRRLSSLVDDTPPPSSIYDGYHPGGIYNAMDTGGLSTIGATLTGRTLGHWAASIDEENDDTHIWVRPTSALVFGFLKAAWEKVWKALAGAVFLALVCAAEWLFGGDDCSGDAARLTSDADLVAKVEGLIPGFGDWSGDPYTTMWHFINVQRSPILENAYDDHEGLYYVDAMYLGPKPFLAPDIDPLDAGILIGTALGGLSIKYDPSNGPKRYEITSDSDHHPATVHRTKGQWQELPLGFTPFEPVDNLAKFGWDQFLGATPRYNRHYLAWPLHALGDASAPHHVIGVTGWGHRPYEDEEASAWYQIRYVVATASSPDALLTHKPSAGEVLAQAAQARRILAQAFTYRKKILAYRAAHPELGPDLPIRDLVTQVAEETLGQAEGAMNASWWPFKQFVSLQWQVGGKGDADATYADVDSINGMRWMIERGSAAIVAFLMSAVEVMP